MKSKYNLKGEIEMKKMIALLLCVLLTLGILPVQTIAAEHMSTEEFIVELEKAVADGTDLVLDKSVVIQENVAINLNNTRLVLTNGSEFGIASGVTAKFTGFIWVRHGTVNVNPGATLDITPSSTVIVGAEGLLLDGVRYESEGGSTFNVNGKLFCGGEIDVIPDGSLWVTHTEAEAHIDGISDNLGAVHVIAGMMEVTGVLNNYGYLAIHTDGKLRTTKSSMLNILNDERGCGYLDNDGTANLDGTVNLTGLCTTSGIMTVDGTMNNNGSFAVSDGGMLSMDGTWNGSKPDCEVGHIYDDNVDGTCNSCGIKRETVEVRQVTHMLRMYNPYTGEHFYTGSEVEKDNLVAAGWQYEGVGFTFPANTGAPVYRLYDPATGEHLYTMDEEEKAALMEAGWNYEGIAFNSAYDTEAVQHRLHNPYTTVGAYHFTFSEEEKQNLINAGWEYQGIGWYSCWK